MDAWAQNDSKTPELDRRRFLQRAIRWMFAFAALLLSYPLFRFLHFRLPPKPRLLEVPAPLPLSGAHSGADFILFGTADTAHAVSRTCTHLGCKISYQPDKLYIECPCHQSRFTPEGKRFAGPAEKDLPLYEVSLKRDAEGRISSYVVRL